MSAINFTRDPSSFRDTSGYVVSRNNQVFRVINESYGSDYTHFIKSGLSERLINLGYLIPFKEEESSLEYWKLLSVKKIKFFTYPHEWSFSQLQDAAELTLNIQIESLKFGMILKDASAYNVTFDNGKPVFIDLLSFKIYSEGTPWSAYSQFCMHFLAPLLLMSKIDQRLIQLLRSSISGISLDLASKLLPKRSYLDFSILMHIHLHSWAQNKYANVSTSIKKAKSASVSKINLIQIASLLKEKIIGLRLREQKTTWGDYYSSCNYTNIEQLEKINIINQMIDETQMETALDIGANNGFYSRKIAEKLKYVVSSDFDLSALDLNYRLNKLENVENITTIFLNIVNPTPGIGWAGSERLPFKERASFDLLLALALIHHLVITEGITMEMIAKEFSILSKNAIVEWVPVDDTQVNKISAMNMQALDNYSYELFLSSFEKYFKLVRMEPISESGRVIHLFARR